MYNVEKCSNILEKSCSVHTEQILKYVWPLFNIMHKRVNNSRDGFYGLSWDTH